ncbi:Lrp/AsnC family transcriptional regulator [Gordonia terrae]|uniref:Lrp/AsnC family transcriptional regulator n=2 Tax=Gordonia terrae TaxID=2055 RepID=A0AAD0KCV1_9ACTN|nr:Lrp/AsnC family transcriptional regulator [Gordonia terrae]VTR07687.1 transcriptional regulator, AsnC family [Clostridioides difficile]ANY23868.1 AsnC family transcriptional regulator [Gordonia terrae]AWO84602.1 Lrp/AsnC family transcriptional regulator [Gordonia terrae]VTS55432.1 Regulatory protein AsnC [Gordonia terrae]GAB42088.1 putative AsnC family transcriptional regulator [Gordonia terrae NBRC 100016]
MSERLDKLDLDILKLIVEEPKAGVREYARRLNVARGTVQARLDKFARDGVITSYRPQMQPTALGYSILAFVHLHIAQSIMDATVAHLATIPEVLEVNSVAGEGDLLCRVVAVDHADFERILQAMIATEGVLRSRSELVLSRRIAPRIVPLLEKKRSEVR